MNKKLNGQPINIPRAAGSASLNAGVQDWAKKVEGELKLEAKGLGILHRKNSASLRSSVDNIKNRIKYKFGAPYSISFRFARHLVFVHKGVGNGTPVDMAGNTERKAKEWFEPVVKRNIEDLADIAAQNLGDSVVAQIHF